MRVFVKPIAGVLIRTPDTKTPVPEKGQEVELSGTHGTFWRRRIKDGSLVITVKEE